MSEFLLDRIDSASAWIGRDLGPSDNCIDLLSDLERRELATAASLLPSDPQGWISMRRKDLPLPTLGKRFSEIVTQLEKGRGFAFIRGLDPSLDDAEFKRQYWVIGAHLGTVVPQNAKGELMGSVTDTGSRYADDVNARGYTSKDELVFHSDAGDAVSLLCVRPAQAGGSNAIVSTMAIYNAVLTEAPHLLPILYRGFPAYIRDDAGAEGVTVGGISTRQVSSRRYPIFSYFEGILSGCVNFKSVRAVPVVSGIPFDEDEQEALDFIEAVANRPEMRLEFTLQRGDIMVVDNYMVLHKREAFVDAKDQSQKRLLLRFWLNLHNARVLEPSIEAAMRSGYTVDPVMEVV